MSAELHPVNRTLLTLLENQVERADAALENLPEEIFDTSPGHDCNSIAAIGRHLLKLRHFQLSLLGSPLAGEVPDPESVTSVAGLRQKLHAGADLLAEAIAAHDPDDWFAVPSTPREGLWGESPTIVRVSRPLNDYVNHLGSIRSIRRLLGHPAQRTQ